MKLTKKDYLKIGIFLIVIWVAFFGIQYLGLMSVLASTKLPLKVSIGDLGKVAYGVTVAGVGLTATVPEPCPGAQIEKQIPELGGGIVGASCWQTNVGWNDESTLVKSDNPGPYLIGGFILVKPGSIGIKQGTGRDDPGGWLVELSIEDVKNFYETSFVSHPSHVPIHNAYEAALINFKSLLRVKSRGGLTIKDDTKLLRTERVYRFVDELPVMPGDNRAEISLNDQTLGDIVTSAQPHFYIVQSVTTYTNNPNRGSTSPRSSQSVDLGRGYTLSAVLAANRLLAETRQYSDPYSINKFLSPPQNQVDSSYFPRLGTKELAFFQKLVGASGINVNVPAAKQVGLPAANDYSQYESYTGIIEDANIIIGMSKERRDRAQKKLDTYYSLDNPESLLSKRANLVKLLNEQPENPANINENANQKIRDQILSIEQQLDLDPKTEIEAEIAVEDQTINSQTVLIGETQGKIDLLKTATAIVVTQSIAVPDLPGIGSLAGGGDFIVRGATNYVYKFLFLEGAQIRHTVGANLDYTKYKLIDDQFTPFNKKVVLKADLIDQGFEQSQSGNIALATTDENSAAISKALITEPLRLFGYAPVEQQASGRFLFFLTIMLLGGILIFGGKRG